MIKAPLWVTILHSSRLAAGKAPSSFPYANDFIKVPWWYVMWWLIFLRWKWGHKSCWKPKLCYGFILERCQKRESLPALTRTSKKEFAEGHVHTEFFQEVLLDIHIQVIFLMLWLLLSYSENGLPRSLTMNTPAVREFWWKYFEIRCPT